MTKGGVKCLGRVLAAWEGRHVYMPLDGQRQAGGMGEPFGQGTMLPIGIFFKATCSLKGSRVP